MSNQQLLDYIKSEMDRGESKENIKQRLLAQGWREEDVEEGFDGGKSKGFSDIFSKRNLIIAGVILGLLLLSVGGVFAYKAYFQEETLTHIDLAENTSEEIPTHTYPLEEISFVMGVNEAQVVSGDNCSIESAISFSSDKSMPHTISGQIYNLDSKEIQILHSLDSKKTLFNLKLDSSTTYIHLGNKPSKDSCVTLVMAEFDLDLEKEIPPGPVAKFVIDQDIVNSYMDTGAIPASNYGNRFQTFVGGILASIDSLDKSTNINFLETSLLYPTPLMTEKQVEGICKKLTEGQELSKLEFCIDNMDQLLEIYFNN